MAISATIIKTQLQLADMDNHVYQDFNLTIAQHPSETAQRLMIRILAFALNASDQLTFTKGLCADDEPELWRRSLSDEIELWIELGTPDEKRLKKACSKSQQVILYTYGGGTAEVWWSQQGAKLQNMAKLSVYQLPHEQTQALAELLQKNMALQVSIQDGEVMVSSELGAVDISPLALK
ncbi:YaeQ family protein [Motilimonas pumila]|uniref:YaeQ family protein n=1 Tax=Motilimonas pumila TaxID=2303987 RepID=A0A418YKH5_9GAMM|nr:YaeQ family protein [Motilimonas pumila]RJG51482.1 YaeQ family protein [Motilimonas pumila]